MHAHIGYNRKPKGDAEYGRIPQFAFPFCFKPFANHAIPYRTQGNGKKRDPGNEKEQDKFKKGQEVEMKMSFFIFESRAQKMFW